jgi:RHS repeat-associated protein
LTPTPGSAPSISLPTGGGALQGIGEKFSPDLHTGTGNLTVPIAIPPGRNGFHPELDLAYSTGAGNGPFGLGWTLGLPGIRRRTARGVPRYDGSDVFVLSGAEDLVPVGGAPPGAQRYRPRTEELFARIDRHSAGGEDRWEVRARDGLVSHYGTRRPADAADGWVDPAAVADPADPGRVFEWRLTLTTDSFGNRIEYAYERDEVAAEGPHAWDQLRLAEIRYADYGDPDEPRFLASVRFHYEPRPDPFSEYRAGFEVRTVRRCTRIDTAVDPGSPTPVRSYHLLYLDQLDQPPDEVPLNGVSLLAEIQVEGHGGTGTERLPPMRFGYTRFAPERRGLAPVEGPALPPGSLASPDYALVDLFGSGLPDLLEMNGACRFWRNEGRHRIGLPREMAEAPAGLALADPGVQIGDANGDGRPDLMVSSADLSGYYPMRFGGLWDRRSFQRQEAAPSFALDDPEVRLVDLDGDGVVDAVRSGVRFECFFNDGDSGWSRTRWVERGPPEEFPDVSFSDPRVLFADMTGDGLQDIVLVTDRNVEYWPALGHGSWGRRISMRDAPLLPYGYDPRRLLLGDVDGDGVADLVYVDDTRTTLWLNRCGNGWAAPIEVDGTPPVSDLVDVRLADMLGTGVQGVLWSSAAGPVEPARMFFHDFTGGAKPYLLDEIDGRIGAVTRIEYAPSTRYFLDDERRPATRWRTSLPFPVQVVARVEVVDQLSGGKLTSEYRYHHGAWDGAEREFRGFGRVDQLDTEVFERYHSDGLHRGRAFEHVEPESFSPPTETRTWFHLGPLGDVLGEWEEPDLVHEHWNGDPSALPVPAATAELLARLPRSARRDAKRTLKGRPLRTEVYALDGSPREDRPYTVTEHRYGIRQEAPGVFFPHRVAERATEWERGRDPMTRFAFTGDHDEYGQARRQVDVGVPRGRDPHAHAAPAEPYLATRTDTLYARRDDPATLIADRVARVTVRAIENDGTAPALELARSAAGPPDAGWPVLGQTLTYFDGGAFEGLALGELGDRGATVRTEQLVLTDELLAAVAEGAEGAEAPYLTPGGPVEWGAEYPAPYRDMPALAGHVFHAGGADPDDLRGYYAQTDRRRYDFHESGAGRGLVVGHRDPLGNDTSVEYDQPFEVVPRAIVDPAGLRGVVTSDYRVMQPSELADPNGNRTRVTFGPLGLPSETFVLGKPGDEDGDGPGSPSGRFVYDLTAFAERGQPISVHSIERVWHSTDAGAPAAELDATVESRTYSDGFGRVLQTRGAAERVVFGETPFGGGLLAADQSEVAGAVAGHELPAGETRVAVSGWQTHDNKGRPVRTHEPFFSLGWDYFPPADAEMGRATVLEYDARGRLVRGVAPDGSEERVVHGVPVALADPGTFAPTAWERYAYDANDNAGRTHPAGSATGADHLDTPASDVFDALGRTIESVARNGPDPQADWLTTRSEYDLLGNLVRFTDALGRVAFEYVHDHAGRPLLSWSIDAGRQRRVLDAAGNVVERRDPRGAVALHRYDSLNRPVRLWARDGRLDPMTLRERLEYGDAGDAAQDPAARAAAAAANRLGEPHRHYDEAGLLEVAAYDFKGNVVEKARRVVDDAVVLAGFDQPPPGWDVEPFRADWEPPPGRTLAQHADALLEPAAYPQTLAYDALDRVVSVLAPPGPGGERSELRVRHNEAGALEAVELDGAPFVDRIAYDANGQRVLVAYGNGVLTRHAYDPDTLRLVRTRSERAAAQAPIAYAPLAPDRPLQDLAYEYDLFGNVTAISERTPGCGVAASPEGPDHLRRELSYDAVYRLVSATGRECDTIAHPRPWSDDPRCGSGTPNQSNAPTVTRAYTERYSFDPAGNLVSLQHSAADGSWTRTFGAGGTTGNRATHVADGGPALVQTHFFDDAGNLLREAAGSRHFEWDHASRMRVFRTQTPGSEPSVYAQYLYGGDGQRVRKVVRKSGRVEVTTYVDGLFEHDRVAAASGTRENTTVHVMDGESRIATVRSGPALDGDEGPPVRYHLADHLGSDSVVVDGTGGWVNREEYAPWGETTFGGFARKRYRFGGRERDESGLTYHGARYYAPWLARWVSPDPIGLAGGPNPYAFVEGSPMRLVDPTGTSGEDTATVVLPEEEAEQASIDLEAESELQREQAELDEQACIDHVKREKEALVAALEEVDVLSSEEIIAEVVADLEYYASGKPGGKLPPMSDVPEPEPEPSAPLPMCGGSVCGDAIGEPGKEVVVAVASGGVVAGATRLAKGAVLLARGLKAAGATRAAGATTTSARAATSAPKAARIPNSEKLIEPHELLRKQFVVPEKGRGITAAHRRWAQEKGERWSGPGRYDAGHVTPHSQLKPGEIATIKPERAAKNRGDAATIVKQNAARRARPELGLFVRPKGSK